LWFVLCYSFHKYHQHYFTTATVFFLLNNWVMLFNVSVGEICYSKWKKKQINKIFVDHLHWNTHSCILFRYSLHAYKNNRAHYIFGTLRQCTHTHTHTHTYTYIIWSLGFTSVSSSIHRSHKGVIVFHNVRVCSVHHWYIVLS